ncbi:hypothetical protein MTO96_028980 [Rhipicephalus appendiculatus]
MYASHSGSEALRSSESSVLPAYPRGLTGFRSDFLEAREVAFVEPIKWCNMCVFCWRVPGSARRLTCSHIMCDGCRDEANVEHERQYPRMRNIAAWCRLHAMCPVDYTAFDEDQLDGEPVNQYRIQEKLVFCVQARFGCPFINKLKYLERHYYNDCRFGPNSCHRSGSTEIPVVDTLRYNMNFAQLHRVIETLDDRENQ